MSSTLAVVGGTGLYDIEGLQRVEPVTVQTPFGPPSDELVQAEFEGSDDRLLFLPRHGRGHRLTPHEINYRANICALKMLGATHVLSISAVGSMREDIAPGDLVVVDQFIDLTKRRVSTFFQDGVVGHVAFSDPVCPIMAEALYRAASSSADRSDETRVHRGGTYVCIEGPQFSSRAESRVYRSWGVDVIGMTNMPEAKLAREAELPYATLALATDYDCWHESEEPVAVEAILARLGELVGKAKRVIRKLALELPDVSRSPARNALAQAVMTDPDLVSPEVGAQLGWLLPSGRDKP